jgi:hypothetical protein
MFLCLTKANVGIHNLTILLASVITKASDVLTECKHCPGFSALQMQMLAWQNPNTALVSLLQLQMLSWQNLNIVKVSAWKANIVLTESKLWTGFSALQMQMLSWPNPNIALVSLPDEYKCCMTESKHCTGFSTLQMQMLSWQNPNIVLISDLQMQMLSWQNPNIVLISDLQMQMLSWQNSNIALVSLPYKYRRYPDRIQTLYLFLPYKFKCCLTESTFYWFLCLTNANNIVLVSPIQIKMLSWLNPNIVLVSLPDKCKRYLDRIQRCTGFSAWQMQILSWQNPNTVLVSLLYKSKCCPDRIQTLYWFLCLTIANVVLTESKHCPGFSALQKRMLSWQNPNIVLVSLPYKSKCCPDRIQTLYWFLCLTKANVVLTESKHCSGFSALQNANVFLTESKHGTGFSLTIAYVVLTESKLCISSLPYRYKCCPYRIQTLNWFLCLTNANVVWQN